MAGTRDTDGDASGDLVGSAAAELYGADPDQFTARRKELATAARKSGDAAAARAIGALAKPTRSAWVVNQAVRADPGMADRLADLGGKLRAGEAALDGASIRELSRTRRELITGLVRQALAEAGLDAPSAALRDEVTDTFSAALADPGVAEQVAAGTLARAAHWAGFGPGIGLAAPAAVLAAAPATAPPGDRTAQRAGHGRDGTGRPAAMGRQAAGQAAALRAAQKAEREREHQRAVARAEATAQAAVQGAEAARATEREVSESVSFMEERLNRERQRLITARRDARLAAAAAERAQTALNRLR
ncbi:MAG: hypothetical protein ACR2FU_14240 [Streptosporangiaceae bacterium]